MNYRITAQLEDRDSFLAGDLSSTKIKHDYHAMEEVSSLFEELAALTKL